MIVTIDENWQIATDQRNVILQQKKVNTRGKNIGSERWETYGFYATHKEALVAMLNCEILVPKEYHEVVSKIDQLMAVVEALPNSFKNS